jgi:branched-chain amino acid transport system substrate-binding protein
MKSSVSVLVALVVSAMIGSSAGSAGAAPATGAPVEFDVVLPATGPAAFIGKSETQGLEAVEALVNRTGGIGGRPIKVVLSDTQSSPQVDVQLVSGLMAKHIAVFIDGGPSSMCGASDPLFEKSGPLAFCLSPNLDPAHGGFVFAAGPTIDGYANVAVRYLRDRGLKRLAMITATDASGMTNARMSLAALQLAENKGVELVANEQFSPTDVSVAAQIAHIKALNPQALLAWTTGTPTATVLRALKDSGLEIPVVLSAANMNVEQLTSYAAFNPKDLLFAAPLSTAPLPGERGDIAAAVRQFRDTFTSANVRPDLGMLLPWDPVLLIVDAMRHVGADASAAQVHEYLARQRSWIGAMGRYDFVTYPQRGLGEQSLIMAAWDSTRNDFTRVSRPGGYR